MEYMEGMAEHEGFFSLIGVLTAFIQLKNEILSPHHAIITTFFVTLLVYVVASACQVNLQAAQFRSIAARTSLLAKILALVLLIIILDATMGWLLFFLWAMWFIWVVYTSHEELSQLWESLVNAVLQAHERLYNAVLQAPARLYNSVLQAYAAHGMAEEPIELPL